MQPVAQQLSSADCCIRAVCLVHRVQVIVFSDNVWALEAYARALNKPFIYGKTSHMERTQVTSALPRSFKHRDW